MQFWEANLRTLTNLLFSPAGIFLSLVFLVLALICITNRFVQLLALTLLLLTMMTSPAAQLRVGMAYEPIAEPFEWVRQNARVLTTFTLCLLLPASLMQRHASLRQRGYAFLPFIVFHVLMTFVLIFRTGFDPKEMLSLASLVLIWIALTGFPVHDTTSWCQSWRPLVYACCAFVSICWILVFMRSPGLMSGHRFQGFTPNPQFTGQVAAIGLVLFAAAIAEPLLRKSLFLPVWLLWLMAGLTVGLLAWTGSRGGGAIALVGLLILFGPRMGRMIFFAVPTALAGWFVLTSFGEFDSSSALTGLQRILTFQNSRSMVWDSLWQQFLQDPLFGRGAELDTQFSESSYLLTAARFGLVGLAPLIIAVTIAVTTVIRGTRIDAPEIALAKRLPLALFCAIVVGAAAEAYLLGRYQSTVAALMISVAASARLSLVAEREETAAVQHPWEGLQWT